MDAEKVKVYFTADAEPKREGGDFKKGKTYLMSPASAERWIRRGKAVTEADAKAAKAEQKAADEAAALAEAENDDDKK